MNTNHLTYIQELLGFLPGNVRTCRESFKAIKAFQHNAEGLAFSIAQLHRAAGTLRFHAEQLSALVEDLYSTFNPITTQEQDNGIPQDEEPVGTAVGHPVWATEADRAEK